MFALGRQVAADCETEGCYPITHRRSCLEAAKTRDEPMFTGVCRILVLVADEVVSTCFRRALCRQSVVTLFRPWSPEFGCSTNGIRMDVDTRSCSLELTKCATGAIHLRGFSKPPHWRLQGRSLVEHDAPASLPSSPDGRPHRSRVRVRTEVPSRAAIRQQHNVRGQLD
jgi:hypothetical protein